MFGNLIDHLGNELTEQNNDGLISTLELEKVSLSTSILSDNSLNSTVYLYKYCECDVDSDLTVSSLVTIGKLIDTTIEAGYKRYSLELLDQSGNVLIANSEYGLISNVTIGKTINSNINASLSSDITTLKYIYFENSINPISNLESLLELYKYNNCEITSNSNIESWVHIGLSMWHCILAKYKEL